MLACSGLPGPCTHCCCGGKSESYFTEPHNHSYCSALIYYYTDHLLEADSVQLLAIYIQFPETYNSLDTELLQLVLLYAYIVFVLCHDYCM